MNEYKNLNQSDEAVKERQINKESVYDENLDGDVVSFFLFNTTQNDIDIWTKLTEIFDVERPYFDLNVTETIISNSIRTIETSEQPVVIKILFLIYNILQNSKYIIDIFEKTQIIVVIGTIIENLESDFEIKNQAFNILDTFLQSLNDDNKYEIKWANNLINNFNTIIINTDEKNDPFFTDILSHSKILFENGAFSNDDLKQNFDFYLSIIENLQQINLSYAIQNFEVILNRLPILHEELYNWHRQKFEFIYSLLDISKYPIIVQTAINILTPIISLDEDFFLKNDYIQLCLRQIQLNNNNKDLAYAFTKSMINFCSISYEACNQLIIQDFLRRKDLIHFGYSIQCNLLQIIKHIVEKTKISFDQFIIENFYYLFNSFILSDDPFEVKTVLSILYIICRVDFPLNEELISNISRLACENEFNDSEISESAALIIQEIRNQEN